MLFNITIILFVSPVIISYKNSVILALLKQFVIRDKIKKSLTKKVSVADFNSILSIISVIFYNGRQNA